LLTYGPATASSSLITIDHPNQEVTKTNNLDNNAGTARDECCVISHNPNGGRIVSATKWSIPAYPGVGPQKQDGDPEAGDGARARPHGSGSSTG